MTRPAVEADAIRAWLTDARAMLDRLEGMLGMPASDQRETLDAWVERWYSSTRSKVSRPKDERRQYELWIRPTLGQLGITTISRADVERWVEQMDRHVAVGRLRSGTAMRLWSFLLAILRDASTSKVRELRVRQDNPARGVRSPDREERRASTFLYPSEFLRLVSCEDVPLVFRQLYAVGVYLYPRAGELRVLRWEDVDMTTGRVHIHRAGKRDGSEGRTKTSADRQFVAERTLLPLLRAMRRSSAGHLVFPRVPSRQNLARELRGHLLRSGCKRADLFASDEGRRPLTFHDLRATGITWMAMRGDSPTDILERVGHAQLATTERYMRRGRLLVARNERVFPALPACLRKKP